MCAMQERCLCNKRANRKSMQDSRRISGIVIAYVGYCRGRWDSVVGCVLCKIHAFASSVPLTPGTNLAILCKICATTSGTLLAYAKSPCKIRAKPKSGGYRPHIPPGDEQWVPPFPEILNEINPLGPYTQYNEYNKNRTRSGRPSRAPY
jgi:hypothetical protein